MNTFLFSGMIFYTASRSKHYATIYISSQSHNTKSVRAPRIMKYLYKLLRIY